MEITFIGLGLSMDALAVALTNSLVYKNTRRLVLLKGAIIFGVFQGGMPIIGYWIGDLFSHAMHRYASFFVFVILGVIGATMLFEGVTHRHHEQQRTQHKALTYSVILTQAFATSIDALAVGFSLSATRVSIIPSAFIIGVTTLLCCSIASLAGKRVGKWLGSHSELLGGAILVLVAIKALF